MPTSHSPQVLATPGEPLESGQNCGLRWPASDVTCGWAPFHVVQGSCGQLEVDPRPLPSQNLPVPTLQGGDQG